MKSLIIIVSLLLASANCEFKLPEEFRNAKDINESPHMQETLRNLYPDKYNNNDVDKKPFIVGGENATFGQIPHQVVMFTQFSLYEYFMCGGSIITGTNNGIWILTAAHCVDLNYQQVNIFFGLIDADTGSYEWKVYVTSENIIKHPDYNSTLLTNDIALIRILNAPENFLSNPNVGNVALPTNYRDTNLIGMNGTVSGWGRYADILLYTSTFLKYVELPIIANSACSTRYGSDVVSDTNICAGTTSTASICGSDSGGPFTVQISGQTILVGVVSFGAAGGCELGYEAVFTRVSSYLDWIATTTSFNETMTTTTGTQDAMKNGVNLALVILIQIFLFARK